MQIDIEVELSRKLLVRLRNLAKLYMVILVLTRRAPPDCSSAVITGTKERVKKARDHIITWVRGVLFSLCRCACVGASARVRLCVHVWGACMRGCVRQLDWLRWMSARWA